MAPAEYAPPGAPREQTASSGITVTHPANAQSYGGCAAAYRTPPAVRSSMVLTEAGTATPQPLRSRRTGCVRVDWRARDAARPRQCDRERRAASDLRLDRDVTAHQTSEPPR